MKEEKRITQADIDGAEVKLKPVAGVSPKIYIPLAYSVLLVALFFLVLILPGITRFGSKLEFSGAPGKSAVYIGEDYRGSTLSGFFLKAGTYSIRIEHEGFLPQTTETHVGGRLLGSLFFPRRQSIGYRLEPRDPKALLESAFSSYAGWSLAGKPSALYQIPPVLSDATLALASTASLGSATGDARNRLNLIGDIFSVSASAEATRDGLKAATLISSAGLPGPLSLAAAAREMLNSIGTKPAATVWLNDILPKSDNPARKAISDASIRVGQKPSTTVAVAVRYLGTQSIAGLRFSMFSSGKASLAGEAPSGSFAPYEKNLPEFGLAVTETTIGQWKLFLAAKPEWRSDTTYSSAADSLPITGISWHAAKAYCDWLTSRVGGAYTVSLPDEAMWEAAAALQDSGDNAVWSDISPAGARNVASAGYSSNGLADLYGNVWEWTSDSFRPYPALAGGYLAHAEKAVRGGSWANSAADMDIASRGGITADHGSAFLGFRPAIFRK